MVPEKAEYSRKTRETEVEVSLNIRGTGEIQVATGLGSLDHMLNLLAFWAGFDLKLSASGDLYVDAHHTVEDVGLCLGAALKKALGDKEGLFRVGWAKIPMDEALVDAALDISGRPCLVYRENILPEIVLGEEKDVWREFFKSLVNQAGMNLHLHFVCGENAHHLLESAFKGTGFSLRQASTFSGSGVHSTKGVL